MRWDARTGPRNDKSAETFQLKRAASNVKWAHSLSLSLSLSLCARGWMPDTGALKNLLGNLSSLTDLPMRFARQIWKAEGRHVGAILHNSNQAMMVFDRSTPWRLPRQTSKTMAFWQMELSTRQPRVFRIRESPSHFALPNRSWRSDDRSIGLEKGRCRRRPWRRRHCRPRWPKAQSLLGILQRIWRPFSAPPEEPPPLPFHSIEGVGGGAITSIAYLVNPDRKAVSGASRPCPSPM